MICNNQETLLKETLYTPQASLDLINRMVMIKVLIQWQSKTMSMYKKPESLQRND